SFCVCNAFTEFAPRRAMSAEIRGRLAISAASRVDDGPSANRCLTVAPSFDSHLSTRVSRRLSTPPSRRDRRMDFAARLAHKELAYPARAGPLKLPRRGI